MNMWRFFPILVKEKVLRYMCIPDIISFAKCSQKCQNLLRSIPIHLPSALIAENLRIDSEYMISLDDFSILATSRKFFVDKLKLCVKIKKNKEDVKVFIQKLTESQNFLKVKELSMDIGDEHAELFTGFLSICDPSSLKSIEIRELFLQEVYDKIVKTPQWKNCDRVSLNKDCVSRGLIMPNININDFLHFKGFKLEVDTLSIDDVVKIVENFRDFPERADFYICCRKPPMLQNSICQRIEESWIGDWKRTDYANTIFVTDPTKPDHVFHLKIYSFLDVLRGGWHVLDEFNTLPVFIDNFF